MAFEELVDILKIKKDKMKGKGHIMQERLSQLLKYSTKVLSNFEKKTEESAQLLHAAIENEV